VFVNQENSRQLVCSTLDGLVCLFDVEDGSLLKTIKTKKRISKMISCGKSIITLTKSAERVVHHKEKKPCTFFQNGFCKHGEKCRFLHGDSNNNNVVRFFVLSSFNALLIFLNL
jgi:hypothetical protein